MPSFCHETSINEPEAFLPLLPYPLDGMLATSALSWIPTYFDCRYLFILLGEEN